MAQNQNNSLPNRLHFVSGQSGSGKTCYVLQHPVVKKARKLLFWDPYLDYEVRNRFDNIDDLKRYLTACIRRGTGFNAAYSIKDPSPERCCEHLQTFCQLLWDIADGNDEIVAILEEIADGYGTIAKAVGPGGQIFRAGRKFGLIIFALAQSPPEVPKTIVKQCKYKAIFFHDYLPDMKRAGELSGYTSHDIGLLQVGEYYLRESGQLIGVKNRTKNSLKEK